MSVLACDRRGCEGIMCDRLSSKFGYICDECFAELCQKGVVVKIEEFMDQSPRHWLPGSEKYFDEIFPLT